MAGIPNPRFVIKERRERVAILLSQSVTEIEIARKLKVTQPTISRDVNAIKKESQQVLQNITKDTLPFEYGKCLNSLSKVIKECWNIFEDKSNLWSDKDKINALRLVKEAVTTRFEILCNGPVTLEVQLLDERLKTMIESNESTSQELASQRFMPQVDLSNPPPF